MKLFTCPACRQLLFFENVQCGRCGHTLAYLPEHNVLTALDPTGTNGLWTALAPEAQGERYRFCDNYVRHASCNWAVAENDPESLCVACRLNHLIPDISHPGLMEGWRKLEGAKRRLIYTLLELELPLTGNDVQPALSFEFKREQDGEKVLTGHNEGVITINVAEAHAPSREQMREQMGEAYRTLLGHFRHEVGHYYWTRLVQDTQWIQPYREMFGDENLDYAEALQQHYANGAPPDWQSNFVSSYASSHPWEDWAESFAHYLHMVDTLETARSHGLSLEPQPVGGAPTAEVKARRLRFRDFDQLIAAWFPLTIALNSFNRGMGLPDIYPFVLSNAAVEKLRFVHRVIEGASAS